MKPLAEVGLFGCVLLQLSPNFKNENSSLRILESVLDAVSHSKSDYVVEFRHRTWLDESIREIDTSASDVLKKRNVASVLIDGPGSPITKEETADHSNIRFHGRNYDLRFKEEKEEDYQLDRYDYLYTKEQLDPWVPRIKEADVKAQKVRVYFNNHARAKA